MTPDPQQTVLVFQPVYTSNTESSDYLAAFTVEPSVAMHRAILEAATATAKIPGAASINLMCLPGIEAWDAGNPESPHPPTNAEGTVLQALTEVLNTPGQAYHVANGNIFVRVYPDGDFTLRFFEHDIYDMTDSEILRFAADGRLEVARGNPPPKATEAAEPSELPNVATGERLLVLRADERLLERQFKQILEFAAAELGKTGFEQYNVQGYQPTNQTPALPVALYAHVGGWSADGQELSEANDEKSTVQ